MLFPDNIIVILYMKDQKKVIRTVSKSLTGILNGVFCY